MKLYKDIYKYIWFKVIILFREELPHVRGQRQKPWDPCPRGGSQEELPHVQGQRQRPKVPGCDSTGTAERSYSTPKAKGGSQEEHPHLQGAVAARAQEGLEELFHVHGQAGAGGGEEIPLVQGKEQWLCFAGAAMKRYPTSKVRESQVRR